jgi:hypothetical protein
MILCLNLFYCLVLFILVFVSSSIPLSLSQVCCLSPQRRLSLLCLCQLRGFRASLRPLCHCRQLRPRVLARCRLPLLLLLLRPPLLGRGRPPAPPRPRRPPLPPLQDLPLQQQQPRSPAQQPRSPAQQPRSRPLRSPRLRRRLRLRVRAAPASQQQRNLRFVASCLLFFIFSHCVAGGFWGGLGMGGLGGYLLGARRNYGYNNNNNFGYNNGYNNNYGGYMQQPVNQGWGYGSGGGGGGSCQVS